MNTLALPRRTRFFAPAASPRATASRNAKTALPTVNSTVTSRPSNSWGKEFHSSSILEPKSITTQPRSGNALAEHLGRQPRIGHLGLREPEVADDRQVLLRVGRDLREFLVVGVAQFGVLLTEDRSAGAHLRHPVDLRDERLGDVDGCTLVVLLHPVQGDTRQGEDVGASVDDGI